MWQNYVYLEADRPIAERISFYYEHLVNAQKAGHACLADWIRALHGQCKGVASKVAEVLGVTYKTAIKWFYNLCLPVRARGGSKPHDHPRRSEVGDIYRRTLSGVKTAKELGVCTRQVYKWLERDGIPRVGKKGKR